MLSGWIGSFFAAGSVNKETEDDLRTLQRRSKEGLWLLIIETPVEIELPWERLQQCKRNEIIQLNDF